MTSDWKTAFFSRTFKAFQFFPFSLSWKGRFFFIFKVQSGKICSLFIFFWVSSSHNKAHEGIAEWSSFLKYLTGSLSTIQKQHVFSLLKCFLLASTQWKLYLKKELRCWFVLMDGKFIFILYWLKPAHFQSINKQRQYEMIWLFVSMKRSLLG